MIAFSKSNDFVICTLTTPKRMRLEYNEPTLFLSRNEMVSWFDLCHFGSFKFYCEQDVDPFDVAKRIVCEYACVNKIKGYLFVGGSLDGRIIETGRDYYTNQSDVYVRHVYYVGSSFVVIYGLKYTSKDHVTKPLEAVYT
jgi:hypothetical protein